MTKQRNSIVLSSQEAEIIFQRITDPVVRLVLSIMYHCGLRLVEALQLRAEHVDFEAKRLRVCNGNSQERHPYQGIVSIPDKLLLEFQMVKTPSGWLFPHHSGTGHITAATVKTALKEALLESGIKKGITVASFRHKYMQWFLQLHESAEIQKFQRYYSRFYGCDFIKFITTHDSKELTRHYLSSGNKQKEMGIQELEP